MSGKADPIIQASNLLVQFMQEEDIEPMVAMTAMTQVAAKIAFDSGVQDKLSEEDNRARWMGGAMLAYDAAAGGTAGFQTPQELHASQVKVAKPRHLSICSGVGKGAKQGFKYRRNKEKNRAANKQARKTRRSQRR
jgi:hypothetical protein